MLIDEDVMKQLKPHQVDHLILLVGRNPLPNAVAGELMTKPGGRISLLHTKGTTNIQKSLQRHLTQKGFQVNDEHEIDAVRSPSIINGVLKCLNNEDKRVGLNYTGGTKAMSVHAFRALETWAADPLRQPPVFSYLDARTLQIRVDPNDLKGGGNQIPIGVGQAIEITIEELIKLHDWTLGKDSVDSPMLPDTARALAEICLDDDPWEAWLEWRDKLVDTEEKKEKLQKQWKGKTSAIALPSSLLDDVTQTLLTELGQSGETVLDLDKAKTNAHFKKIKHFCEWVHGKWIEHHLLKTLKDLPLTLNLHSCKQNVETQEVQFDLDVVAMRGYQLFGFSCTTDEKKYLCKSKLFEADLRASQLGGDEARVALVCLSSEPEKIEDEVRGYNPEGRIRVFGLPHLAKLKQEIEEWIISQEGIAT